MFERIYNKFHMQQVIPHNLFIKSELISLKLPTSRPVIVHQPFMVVVHINVTIL